MSTVCSGAAAEDRRSDGVVLFNVDLVGHACPVMSMPSRVPVSACWSGWCGWEGKEWSVAAQRNQGNVSGGGKGEAGQHIQLSGEEAG